MLGEYLQLENVKKELKNMKNPTPINQLLRNLVTLQQILQKKCGTKFMILQ